MRHLLETALAAADAAAQVHGRWAGRIRTEEAAEKTTNSDFVSQVDLEAQEAALSRIRAAFPDHQILAEEEDGEGRVVDRTDTGRPTWVVDPLDGTTNFLHGHPAYASSVGVVVGDEPLAGAVVAAATRERWWAARGLGSFRNGDRIRVSRTDRLQHALVGTGFPFKALDQLPRYLQQFGQVLETTSGVRRGGSAALDLCYLAQGSLDAFWELELSPWDIAAGLIILQEAGGCFRRIEAPGMDLLHKGSVLAANSPRLQEELRIRLASGGETEAPP